MTLFDKFRALKADLFDKFDAVTVAVTHTEPGVRTDADRARGRINAPITTTFTVRGFLGSTNRKAKDGTLYAQTTATLDAPVSVDDRIAFGSKTFTVTTVNEVNPDGVGGIVYKVDLK